LPKPIRQQNNNKAASILVFIKLAKVMQTYKEYYNYNKILYKLNNREISL
jgi:hypothetical protein